MTIILYSLVWLHLAAFSSFCRDLAAFWPHFPRFGRVLAAFWPIWPLRRYCHPSSCKPPIDGVNNFFFILNPLADHGYMLPRGRVRAGSEAWDRGLGSELKIAK